MEALIQNDTKWNIDANKNLRSCIEGLDFLSSEKFMKIEIEVTRRGSKAMLVSAQKLVKILARSAPDVCVNWALY